MPLWDTGDREGGEPVAGNRHTDAKPTKNRRGATEEASSQLLFGRNRNETGNTMRQSMYRGGERATGNSAG